MTKTADTPEPSVPEDHEPRRLGRWLAAVLRAARAAPEERALRDAAEALDRDGAVVFAAAPGWPRPPVINGFLPDVYAVYRDREILLELDVEDPGVDSPAPRRSDAFAAWAAEAAGREHQQIVVPRRGKA